MDPSYTDLIQTAEQGDAQTQVNLGVCYAKGRGVEQDYEQAVYWWRQAAEQGNANAQDNLGLCYASGKQAIYWWRKAAEQGDLNATQVLQALGVLFG